jgi:LysM repeat protein
MMIYKVKTGDSLSKIARKFDVSMEAVATLNGITNPDRIRVGQELRIPENTTDIMTSTVAPTESPPVSEVRSGDPPVNRSRFRLPAKEYCPEVMKKDLIVLHFTAGKTAQSAYQSWLNNPVAVATAYLVDRDGKIYEVFDPAHWAYHLGVKGSRGKHDRRSIGIEIASVGPLKPSQTKADQLNWWPPGNEWRTRYCHRDESDRYVNSAYRGIDFFASIPAIQQDSVAALTRYLCDRFEVPKTIPSSTRRTKYSAEYFGNFSGVASHQNFRSDKWDVGPAFDWDRLGF